MPCRCRHWLIKAPQTPSHTPPPAAWLPVSDDASQSLPGDRGSHASPLLRRQVRPRATPPKCALCPGPGCAQGVLAPGGSSSAAQERLLSWNRTGRGSEGEKPQCFPSGAIRGVRRAGVSAGTWSHPHGLVRVSEGQTPWWLPKAECGGPRSRLLASPVEGRHAPLPVGTPAIPEQGIICRAAGIGTLWSAAV